MIAWVRSRFDGDWEHCTGFQLENLDDPGWKLTIDLGPFEEGQSFGGIDVSEGTDVSDEFLSISLSADGILKAMCNDKQLERMLKEVRERMELIDKAFLGNAE